MTLLLIFITGLASGMFLEIKLDDYRDYRLEALEQIIELDESEDWSFHESPTGDIWATRPGVCVRVF